MRAVIQRVLEAKVSVDGNIKSQIESGLIIFLGIEHIDSKEDAKWLAKKIAQLRIFSDKEGVSNNSIIDIDGEIIVVSQFTLHAKTKKGNRPSYIRSAKSSQAVNLYEEFKNLLSIAINKEVKSGEFGANMEVALINSGPMTIIIDTKNKE